MLLGGAAAAQSVKRQSHCPLLSDVYGTQYIAAHSLCRFQAFMLGTLSASASAALYDAPSLMQTLPLLLNILELIVIAKLAVQPLRVVVR